MGGAGAQGPRKLDSIDKQNYKELGSNQAASARDKVQAVNEKEQARAMNSSRQKQAAAADDEESQLAACNGKIFSHPSQ